MEKNKGFWIISIYLFLAIYLLPMFPHGGSANELTRWATAASLVEKSSFDIAWTEDLIGPNVDTARIDNHVYSNKPPGIAMIAAPIYALTRAAIGPPNDSNIRISWFVMRFFLSTLPLLLLGLWLYARDTDELSLTVLFFASPLFVYSLLFFSHVLVGVLIYISYRVIFDARRIFLRNCFLAGAISGVAVLCEFAAAVPVAVIGLSLLFTNKNDRLRNIVFFIAGGLPFAVVLLIYNNTLFGSLLEFSYGHESFPEWAEVAGQGVYGIGLPSLSNLYVLIFSPSRGLFFTAPILLLSIAAFFSSRESNTLRHRVKIAAIVVTVIVMSGHGAAHGGWAFGPRYLIMLLPLMLDSFFDGDTYDYSNLWQGFLFAISFVLCTIPILTFPFAPPEFKYPHNSFWTKLLWEDSWYTPNLANAFGMPSSVWTIVPVVIMLAAVFYVVWRYARRPARFFIGALAGLIVVGVYLALPNLESTENRFRRATIAERYYVPANRLDAFRGTVDPARIRQYEWIIAESRAYAPNDFPYIPGAQRNPSPTAEIKEAVMLQQAGKTGDAEAILARGKETFPFARCEFGTNLAVLLYSTDRKEGALRELEEIQSVVGPGSRPDCLRSQFLLGSLYQENGRQTEAAEMFQKFLANTDGTTDPQLRQFRKQLGR